MLTLSKALNYIQHLSLIAKKPVCAANISLRWWACIEKLKYFKKAKKISLFKVLHCSPWNSFLPRILLKSKERTCNNDTTEVKYYKFDHFQRYFSVFPALKNHVVFTVPITCTRLAHWHLGERTSSKRQFDWIRPTNQSDLLLYTARKC